MVRRIKCSLVLLILCGAAAADSEPPSDTPELNEESSSSSTTETTTSESTTPTPAPIPDPIWRNSRYSLMQNVTRVLSKPKGFVYFIPEGTFTLDPLRNIMDAKPFLCGDMEVRTEMTGNTSHFLRSHEENIPPNTFTRVRERVKFVEDTSPNYTVPNKARARLDVENSFNNDLAILDLVYSDYATCALFFYESASKGVAGDCEVWTNQKPPQPATPCQLLAKFVCENTTISYYRPSCYKWYG